jgi:hypothetical protein
MRLCSQSEIGTAAATASWRQDQFHDRQPVDWDFLRPTCVEPRTKGHDGRLQRCRQPSWTTDFLASQTPDMTPAQGRPIEGKNCGG